MMNRRHYLQQAALAGGGLALLGARALRGQAEGGKPESSGAGAGKLLKTEAGARGLLAGCAVSAGPLKNDAEYRRTLAEQYSLVVGENCMKFGPLQPAPDRYNFDDADALVAFAGQHGMKVRGHNFVWHQQLPSWFEGTATKDNARQILTGHILTVGGRYKGKMQSWDVVNEAINLSDGRPDGLRKSPWLELLGPEYLALAYRTARQADPHAKLAYNEYGIEYDSEDADKKRAAVLDLLRRLKKQGAPVDALGIQSHLRAGNGARFGAGVRKFIDDAQAMGMEVYITEMDVNDDNVAEDDQALRDRAVAQVYGDYLNDVLQSKAVKAVLTWGLTDRYTWLNTFQRAKKKHPDRKERPLPFDAEYQPKPAFDAMCTSFSEASVR